MEWPARWSMVGYLDEKAALEAELRRELGPGHLLFGLPVAAIGRRHDQDDVLFELGDGSGRVAEVHLTWAGKHEKPPWPSTTLFTGFEAWTDGKGGTKE